MAMVLKNFDFLSLEKQAVQGQTVPVEYISSGNAWMTSAIFKDWFHISFCATIEPIFRLPDKALL